MKKTIDKDVANLVASETSKAGKITRKSKTRKADNGSEQAYCLYWVTDAERQQAFKDFISNKAANTIAGLKADFPDEIADVIRWTDNFRYLLASESETNDKYKSHVTIGRKAFGVLDYCPISLEGLFTVFEGARLAIKEQRVAELEKQREQQREQVRLDKASELTIEQLQAILASKLAEQG